MLKGGTAVHSESANCYGINKELLCLWYLQRDIIYVLKTIIN